MTAQRRVAAGLGGAMGVSVFSTGGLPALAQPSSGDQRVELTTALARASDHIDGGRSRPAVCALQRFIAHLAQPKRPAPLTEDAATALRGQANAILATLD